MALFSKATSLLAISNNFCIATKLKLCCSAQIYTSNKIMIILKDGL